MTRGSCRFRQYELPKRNAVALPAVCPGRKKPAVLPGRKRPLLSRTPFPRNRITERDAAELDVEVEDVDVHPFVRTYDELARKNGERAHLARF